MAARSAEVPRSERPPALTFRQRIALAFGAAALLIAATGLICFSALRESVQSDRALLKEARDVIEFGRLRTTIDKKIAAAREFLLSGDEKSLPEIERWHGDLHSQIQSLRTAGLTPKEKDLL
ncbi:MAG TPA: hypothetical protein VEO02_13055, partial [Thermoanaerobaculia bacterium]|nr:hypothetical protein [Thermoanaerobaculia bacterium]